MVDNPDFGKVVGHDLGEEGAPMMNMIEKMQKESHRYAEMGWGGVPWGSIAEIPAEALFMLINPAVRPAIIGALKIGVKATSLSAKGLTTVAKSRDLIAKQVQVSTLVKQKEAYLTGVRG